MPDAMDHIVERTGAWLDSSIEAARLRREPGLICCEECEAEIPAARRAAHPSARRCIPCQEAMEKARG